MVGRAAAVLRAVAAHEPAGATTSAAARGSGLPRPTAHRMLTSLLGQGLLDRDPGHGRWVLGPELYLLGTAAQDRYDVTGTAAPHVRRISEATAESAFFSAVRGEETICLLREDGSFPIRSHVLFEGVRFPLGVVSAGLVVLAHLPDAEVEEYLARVDLTRDHGAQHAPGPLRGRIARTREEGYAVNPGLVVPGSWGVAAAVFDAEGRPRWALSLTGIEQRLAGPRLAELGELMLREAHALSRAVRAARGGRTGLAGPPSRTT